MNIRITESAYADIETASQFYEVQEVGLGSYFQDSIFSDIDSLLIYAGIHQKQYAKYRFLSQKFPYAIYYDFGSSASVVGNLKKCICRVDYLYPKKLTHGGHMQEECITRFIGIPYHEVENISFFNSACIGVPKFMDGLNFLFTQELLVRPYS